MIRRLPLRRSELRPAILLALVAVVPPALEAQSIRATVNTKETAVNQPILMRITVEGKQRIEPQLPELPDFEVVPRGSSSNVQIINGRMSSSVTYDYALVPLRTGSFTVGPTTIEIEGQVYQTRPFQVTVSEAPEQPSEKEFFFVRATVSTTTPYVGQQVLYTWRFFRRVQVAGAQLQNLDFGDLIKEDLGDSREYSTTVDGLEYLVSEIRKALFPLEPGEVVIPPSELTFQVAVRGRTRRSVFDDFFGRVSTEPRTLRTQPITLDVQPLPEPPADFSGLVGSFELSSSLSKRELQVGESATLELSLAGNGNVQLMTAPELPDLSAFKTYPDKPSSSLDRSVTGLKGRKTFRTALVPLQAGNLVVPAVDLVYFDPDAEVYRTTATKAITLAVAPAEGPEELMLTESVAPTTGKVAVRILADDILPLHRGLDAVASQVPSGWALLGSWLGFLVPPIGFLALFAVRRREEQHAADTGLRRRRTALRRANGAIRALREGHVSAPSAGAREASRLVRQYIGDKLSTEGGALTAAEAESLLLEAGGVKPATARQVRELLGRLEAAQFEAGGDRGIDARSLADKLVVLLKTLDREIQEPR